MNWEPAEATASNPQTGEKIALVGGQWVPIAHSASNGAAKMIIRAQAAPAVPPAAPAAPARPASIRQEYPATTAGVDLAAGTGGAMAGAKGGAILGAPFGGPVGAAIGGILGAVVGGGLGYGASREAQQIADRVRGAAAPETAGEMAARVSGNVGTGAASEAIGRGLAPVVSPLIRIPMNALTGAAGRVMDLGRTANYASGRILRESLDDRLPAAVNALANIPAGMTPAQALQLAGVNAPVMQTLLSRGMSRTPAGTIAAADIAARQRGEDIAALAAYAGGGTATKVRQTARASQNALNERLGPSRDNALARANMGTETILGLTDEAAALRGRAAEAVDTVRRLSATPPEASLPRGIPAILGGDVPPTPTVTDRALGNTASQVPGQARISNRYTYPGELADLAIRKADEAAAASLDFGAAARFREAGLADLAANGIRQPLQIAPLQARIAAKLKDPQYAGLDVMEAALKQISDDFAKWSNKRGVIDAEALDALRKNSINTAIAKMRPDLDAKAQAKLAAGITSKFSTAVTDAIEEAGGKGYRQYLRSYTEGMRQISERKMGGELLRLYNENPTGFLKAVRGDNPKLVEKIFGPGKIDIETQLSPSALNMVRGIASRLEADQAIKTQVTAGEEAYKLLLQKNMPSLRVPNWFNPVVTATNKALDAVEARLGDKIMTQLTAAARDGKTLSEAIKFVPATERNRVLRVLRQGGASIGTARTATRAVSQNALAEEPEAVQ